MPVTAQPEAWTVNGHAACHQPVLGWAEQAAPGDVAAAQHLRIGQALDADRHQKTQQIQALEREIAGRLAQTPYVLLLSFPGINVASAAEAGPVEHYATAKTITGRADLRPSRYQSDQVDRANGPLVRACNHSLRGAILTIANNLIMDGFMLAPFEQLETIRINQVSIPRYPLDVWIYRNRKGQRDLFSKQLAYRLPLRDGIAVYPLATTARPLGWPTGTLLVVRVDCEKQGLPAQGHSA